MSPDRASHPSRCTGFTLIELLVVILIISILLAATLTIVPKVKRAVYGAETQAQLSALANAIQQYYNDYKSYPGPLGNNQLNTNGDTTLTNSPYIVDPLNSANSLTLGYFTPASPAYANTNYIPSNMNLGRTYITGAQNLVLGLLGGLEYINNGDTFVYNAQDIFTDGQTPAPRGPASLNATSPKRQQAYIQVKAGDLSTPSLLYNGGSGGSFQDEALRSPQDAMIPVFLDKYSNPMPILYYRTNVSGTAIVGFRNLATIGGAALQDQALLAMGGTPPNEVAQYDLLQNLPYTKSALGTIASNSTNSFHGLIGLGNANNLSDAIDSNVNGTYVPTNGGSNAIAYFKDPSVNPPYDPTVDTSVTNTPSNTHVGTARQKDGFLLISAGPDRLYGTHDDNIYPGGAP